MEPTQCIDEVDHDVDAAARWLTSALAGKDVRSVVTLIGAGNGRVLEALDRCAPNAKVLVLEPDPARARAFLAQGTCADRIATGRLAYLADPDYEGADEAWRVFPAKEEPSIVVVHPSAAGAPGTTRAKEVLKRILFGVRANAEARRRFAPRYLLNSLHNIPAIVAGSDVRALTDAYAGVPAVVVAAGPSLDGAIARLREAKERALVIACDTALRPLLHAGIAPQLVVALDPSTANARHFLELPECRDTWLVAESALDRAATSLFQGRTFWFRVSNHHPWPWLNEQGIDVGKIDVWGSVLTGAFQVACLAGCDPIVFVGADLAYTGKRPYARGTTYEFDWAQYTAIGQTLADTWNGHMWNNTVDRVPDVLGGSTLTTTVLMAFRDWIAARAKRGGRRIVNATGAGILCGDGIEQGSLDVVADDVAIRAVASLSVPIAIGAATALANQVRAVRSTLQVDGASATPLSDWAEFTGEAFDDVAIGTALEGAARELDTLPGRSAVESHALSDIAEASAGILTRIPEALVRLRSALRGVVTPPNPRDADVDRNRALTHALGLVDRVARMTRDSDSDLTLVPRESPAPPTPVSGLYEWTGQTQWAVEVAEALLGVLWRQPTPRCGDFFTRAVMLRGSDATPETTIQARPHANNARAMLGTASLRCAVDPEWSQGSQLCRVLFDAAMGQCASVTSGAASSTAIQPSARARIRLAWPRSALEFEIPVDERSLARLLTGTLRASTDDAHVLPLGETGCELTIDLARGGSSASPSFVAPIVLTDNGVPRAAVAYSREGEAVAVTLHPGDSIVIREDGSIGAYHRWPRPILAEIPFGTNGALAWSDGLAEWPEVRPGYVMYRENRDGEVRVHDLPIRPVVGVWWQGRLYWSCFPRRVESWTGIASWAPGEDVRLELPGFPAVLGMHAGETGLVLEQGGAPTTTGAWERRFTRNGWSWVPGQEPVAFRLAPFGVASARAVHGRWTATAYPEADGIRLQSANGSSSWLTCYYPYALTWVGDSLLVSTLQRELLLFQSLVAVLEK